MTCVNVGDGIVCMSDGPYKLRYTTSGGRERIVIMTWHRHLGPGFEHLNGEPFLPSENHPLWEAFQRWDTMKRPVDDDGFCVLE